MLLQIPDSPARVATITDWIDPDDNVLSSWGAEQADYESYNPPRIVANQPMTDMTELAAVSGYTVQEVQMLMPWITVLPGAGTSQLGASATTPININTASEELLLALGGFYGTQFVDTVAQGRPFSTIDALYDNLNTNLGLWDASGSTGVGNGIGRANKIWPPDLINVWSSYFRVYLKAEIGEAEIEVTSIMHRVGGNLDVISRDISLVPAVLPVKKELSEVEKLFAGNGSEVESDGRYDTDNSIVQPACLMMES
jgi:general secretion pathway protein K